LHDGDSARKTPIVIGFFEAPVLNEIGGRAMTDTAKRERAKQSNDWGQRVPEHHDAL
jgi:hypothetical protein